MRVAIEKSMVTRTANAPRMSKFSRSHRLVIQKEYHIYIKKRRIYHIGIEK